MATWGYSCSFGSCNAVAVAAHEWITHVSSEHSAPGDAAQALNARTPLTAAPAAGAQPQWTAPAGFVPSLFDQLNILESSVTNSRHSTVSAAGSASVGELDMLLGVIVQQVGGGDELRPQALAALMEHLFVTDGGEETALTGRVILYDSAGGERKKDWSSIFAAQKTKMSALGVENITPRRYLRLLAKDIYRMHVAHEGFMAKYAQRPPNWAVRYEGASAWIAASSVFEHMVPAQERTEEQKAMMEAHQSTVSKVSQQNAMLVRRVGVDGSGLLQQRVMGQHMARLATSAAARGDVNAIGSLMQLVRRGNDRSGQPLP